MKHLIMVLGSPNDNSGNLSRIALDRLNCVLDLYKNEKNARILCTGGFGEHFNATDTAHAVYARTYLIRNGVKESDFLPDILSSNTVDDFRMSMEIISENKPETLTVVTSDYHMERVQLLHHLIMNYPSTRFVSAKSSLSPEELAPLIAHEKKPFVS